MWWQGDADECMQPGRTCWRAMSAAEPLMAWSLPSCSGAGLRKLALCMPAGMLPVAALLLSCSICSSSSSGSLSLMYSCVNLLDTNASWRWRSSRCACFPAQG